MAAPALTADLIKRQTGTYDVEVLQYLELNEQGFTAIQSLEPCVNLVKLSLSGNQISRIEGLDTLVRLQRLDLSSNRIQTIQNLGKLVALDYLDLRANEITSLHDIAQLTCLRQLRQIFLQDYNGTNANPACSHPSYHEIVTRHLPKLDNLDGESLNLRKCMADVELEPTEPDLAELPEPPTAPWCEHRDLDWSLEPIDKVVQQSLAPSTERFQTALQACREANSRTEAALRQLELENVS